MSGARKRDRSVAPTRSPLASSASAGFPAACFGSPSRLRVPRPEHDSRARCGGPRGRGGTAAPDAASSFAFPVALASSVIITPNPISALTAIMTAVPREAPRAAPDTRRWSRCSCATRLLSSSCRYAMCLLHVCARCPARPRPHFSHVSCPMQRVEHRPTANTIGGFATGFRQPRSPSSGGRPGSRNRPSYEYFPAKRQ